MKGEYVEDQDENQQHQHQQHSQSQSHHQLHNLNSMFPNFPPPHQHHNHSHNHHSKFQPLPLPPPPHFSRSEDSDSAASLPPPPSSKKTKHVSSAEDGGTVEVSRRPRGRPPGSKNKPKPPVVITRENEPPMSPYILEVPSGTDIVDSLTRFTRRRGLGICVLTASGAVTNVTLKQPSTAAPAGTVTFHGRFDILSLSAVLLNAASFGGSGVGNGFAFTISLAGPQGQIVGGKVVGPLLSSGTVYVIAASFSSPSYHRLPSDDQEVAVQNQATGSAGDGQSGSPASAGDGGSSGGGGGGPVGMYSCHLGTATSDVIWAPTARPPPPY